MILFVWIVKLIAEFGASVITDGRVNPVPEVCNLSIHSIQTFHSTGSTKANGPCQGVLASSFYCERSSAVTPASVLIGNTTCTEHAREDGGKTKHSFFAGSIRHYWHLNLE